MSTDVPLQGPTATSVTKDSLRPTHSRPAAITREPPARLRRVPSPSMGPRPPWSEDATGPVALRPIPLRRLWRRVMLKLFAGMTFVTYLPRLAGARLLRHTCHNFAEALRGDNRSEQGAARASQPASAPQPGTAASTPLPRGAYVRGSAAASGDTARLRLAGVRCGSPEGNFSTCQRPGCISFGTGDKWGFLNSSCIFLSHEGSHWGEGTNHHCCCYTCALRETPSVRATIEAHAEFLRHLEREQSILHGATAVLAPLEAQGRGFMHPHAICASQPAVTTPVPLEFSAGPTDPSP